MIANVRRLQGKFAGKGMLDTNRPVFNVGSTEVAIHGKGVARTGVGSEAVAALNQASHVGRIDRGGLILPGKTGSGDGDPSGENVSGSGATGRTCGVENRRASRNGAKAERNGILCVLLGKECVHGQKAVDETPSCADDGGALPGHVPSNTQARRKVLVVSVIDRTDVLAYLFKADGGLPISEQVFGFLGNTL